MVNDIFINRKQLAAYLGCHFNTARTKYPDYIKKAGKEKGQQLTMYDLQRIDKVPLEYIRFKIFGDRIRKEVLL